MQMKLRSVTCAEENFTLVGRCRHVPHPHLSYLTHKVILWVIENKVVQLLMCKPLFHTSILLIISTDISTFS